MHLFSKTTCIFKYKCMHVNARGYGSIISLYGLYLSPLGCKAYLINVN